MDFSVVLRCNGKDDLYGNHSDCFLPVTKRYSNHYCLTDQNLTKYLIIWYLEITALFPSTIACEQALCLKSLGNKTS